MRTRTPMPFVDTGFPAPNDFANSAGIYDYSGGVVRSRLRGRFVRMVEGCVPPGATISETSSTGALDLGGSNGQHDCESAPSGGDTPSSRTTYYEANRIAEIARGYLPANAWLQSLLTARTNVPGTAEDPNHCNAFWDLSAINFFSSGSGCRNTGEIAAVVDHEWGHGLDDNDTLGMLPDWARPDWATIPTIPGDVSFGRYENPYAEDLAGRWRDYTGAIGGIVASDPLGNVFRDVSARAIRPMSHRYNHTLMRDNNCSVSTGLVM